MLADEIARRYQFRDGYELVDYSAVGLPIFRLTIEAITMAKTTLPVIEEFVLKALKIGIVRAEDISEFYGLDNKLTTQVVDELHRKGSIFSKASQANDVHYVLTEQGINELLSLIEYTPQNEQLVVDYDGLRRQLVWHPDMLLSGPDLKAEGAIQIRPYPAAPPEVQDLTLAQVTKVVRYRGNEFDRDILHLKRIIRRRVYFRAATALIFRSRTSKKDLEVGFIVDDQLNNEYELKFAEHEGASKMGFLKDIDESDIWKNIQGRLGSKIVSAIPSPETMHPRIKSLSELSLQLASLRKNVENTFHTKDKTKELQVEVGEVEKEIAKLNLDMNSFGIRKVYPYEYRDLLEASLVDAKKSLVITSEFVSPLMGAIYFTKHIETLLKNKVNVSLFLAEYPEGSKRVYKAFSELIAFSKKYPNLKLAWRTGEKVHYLIKDENLGIMTSRPFLGARGGVGFKCAIGVLATNPEYVKTMMTSGKFESCPKYVAND